MLLVPLALATGLLAARPTPAALWSIEADCAHGDWWVEVELTGFGVVDASCEDGGDTRRSIEVGPQPASGGRITAISSRGTVCEGPDVRDTKLELQCGSETEDPDGFEVEEELEVEVELEEPDEVEEDEIG
jgi:hypothetical protein